MRRRWLQALALVVLLGIGVTLAPASRGDSPDPIRPDPDVVEISGLALLAEGLAAPTDVAIDDRGIVYVLDGYAGQIRVFGADGVEATPLAVDGERVGLCWSAGRLWVPRADRPVVSAYDLEAGSWEEFPVDGAADSARLTDAVVVDDRVVVISNEHQLWAMPLDGGSWEELDAPDLLGVPFLVAAGPGDVIAISDVLENQVVLVDMEDGEQVPVGQWGVWEGSFLHPAGVALDGKGRLFVSDPSLGVVQVFDREGTFLGALGQGDKLLRLRYPMGIAVGESWVYLVDWSAGRLYRMKVSGKTRPASRRGLYQRKVPRISYLEPDEDTRSAFDPVCRTCHDGSLQSSPQVWDPDLEHHPVDIVPHKPVPPPYTLDGEGQLYCGTCHIPHRMSGDKGADVGQMEVFLKEPRARSELCRSCHPHVVEEVRGVEGPIPEDQAGHLVGAVDGPVARSGAAAIAPDVERVECLDCHAPHGAFGEMLLSPVAASSGGCTRCHAGVDPERGARTHPVNRPLTDSEAIATLQSWDFFLGPQDSVACLTCHDVHRSPEKNWLTQRMEANRRCVVCHADQASLEGGQHDLRRGASGHVGTACLACHTIHEAAGPALGTTAGPQGDPTGCLACHGSGGSARKKVRMDAGHPVRKTNEAPGVLPSVGPEGSTGLGTPGETGCLSCHDPHTRSGSGTNTAMLRAPGGDARGCLACHEDKKVVRDSDHDLRRTDGALSRQRAGEMENGGFCLGCHGFHDASGWNGWGAPPGGPAGESMASRSCLGCHQRGNGAGATAVTAWDHPSDLMLTTAKVPWHNTGELPLYNDQGRPTDDNQVGQIACLTCHDPHVWSPKQGGQGGAGQGDTQSSFLRKGWDGFCAGCHGEDALSRYRYFHDTKHREQWQQKAEVRDWPIYGQDGESQ
jgi:predicted CXXCH cytochrome family protein